MVKEDLYIDRNKLLDECILRERIQNVIQVIIQENIQDQQSLLKIKKQLRTKLLKEEAASDVEESPHESTGINVLEDLLKKIVPELEQGYKRLTTNAEQRKSFKNHILKAVQNTLSRADITDDADNEGGDDVAQLAENIANHINREAFLDELITAQEDINIDVEDDAEVETKPEKNDKFIDIDKKKDDNEEEDTFSIAGEDETGRNMAMMSYEKLEKQILDAYSILSDPKDEQLFYEYLMTNLKLYFERFETELDPSVSEPLAGADEDEMELTDNGEDDIGNDLNL